MLVGAVGIEPKNSAPDSRRMMMLQLPPCSNWSQIGVRFPSIRDRRTILLFFDTKGSWMKSWFPNARVDLLAFPAKAAASTCLRERG